jgi:hypothetical protein
MPNTKPDIIFNDDGICNACTNFENRKNIDWDQRKKDFEEIIRNYKSEPAIEIPRRNMLAMIKYTT